MDAGSADVVDLRGTVWRRWDPHLHVPGTRLADQYKGSDPWDEFLTAIEDSDPTIEVLGITDYWTLDSYERVVEFKEQGRMPAVACVFPNIELRFSTTTAKGSALNMHLLVSPEDPEHIEMARRFLGRLTFQYRGEPYHCQREDLIRLGRAQQSGFEFRSTTRCGYPSN